MIPEMVITPNHKSWIKNAVEMILKAANQAIRDRGRFSLVLSGGSTPQPVFQALALPENLKRIILSRTHIFWGDERCVPPGDPASNYRMAKLALLENAPIPAENIHRIHGENRPKIAAHRYQEEIDLYFSGSEPKFDLVLLGLGNDGHTASLFPETDALTVDDRWVAANFVPTQQTWRITLTYPALKSARQLLFLVKGEDKAQIVQQVLEDPMAENIYPAARSAAENPNTTWLLDKAASRELSILENDDE
jgi:6-phosphogluconolactonase